MIIALSDTWRVRRYDRMNFVVEELVTIRPKGEPEREDWKRRGFYGSIESALRALPEHLSLSEAVTTWEQLTSAWDALIRGRRAE